MKPVFPATYSTLSPHALADFLTERYPLDSVRCTFLVRGVGDAYLVDSDQGRFILRIYRATHRSFSHVQAEVALLKALQHAGVALAYPIADRLEECIHQLNAVEGSRYAVLFSYAPGQPTRILNNSQLRALGHETARFHQISSTVTLLGERWIFDLNTTLFQPLERLKSAFLADQESYLWLQQAARQIQTKIALVDTTGFLNGYCHFDLLPKNMHFEGDSVTLFDFDFMGYGWLVYDLVSFWQHLALEVYAGRMTQSAFEEAYGIFLESYQSCHPISDQELALVPYLSLGFWLFYMGFHTTHDQFTSYLQPSHLKVYTGFLRHLATSYWE